jgi:predicted dehydrogenase
VGMQRRSFELFHKARAIKQSGALGVVRMVRSWWLNNGIQPIENPKLVGNLDWEKWQGPAPRRPFDPARFLDWRNYSDYSGGMVADQGAHIYDGIHLVMDAGYPTAVNASSGRPHKPGVDLPESVVVAAEYPQDFVAVFTINYAAMKYKNPNDQINQFDGDQARMDVGRGTLKVFKQGAEEEAAMEASGSFDKASEKHVENFLECVRTRAEPNAPVEKGFHAALVVQMANISLKLGRRVRWNPSLRKVEV